MAGYFEELGFEPLRDGQTPNHFLHMARLLRDMNMFEELGVNEQLPPPASKEAVEKLPNITIKDAGLQCPICLKDFEVDSTAVQMPCQHNFHSECINPWLNKTNSCPLCRHELPTDDETYELFKLEKQRAKERAKDIENLHNSMFS